MSPQRATLCEAEAKLGRDDKALVDRARQGLFAAIGNRGGSYKSWVTGHARIRLGRQLLRTKEYAEAEQMLTAGLRDMIDEYPHIRDYALNAIPEGHRSLLDLYQELRRLAAAKMAQEDPGNTLDATSLVHEAGLVRLTRLDLPVGCLSGQGREKVAC